MGGTLLVLRIPISVRRSEHLPEDLDADGVCNEVRDVINKALAEWHENRGHELVRSCPEA